MTDRLAQRTRFGIAAGLGAAAFLAQCWSALPFIADDALISLRYARRLLDGNGLTFTDGEWVEGYSNLLHVLGSAAFGAMGMDLVHAARAVGIVGGLLGVVAVAAYSSRRGVAAGVLGALMLGASPGLGIWATGGLEQPLLAGLLAAAWALALVEADDVRVPLAAGGFFALACLTRPDPPLFVAIAFFWAWGFRGWRDALAIAAPPVVAVLAQLGFRLVYYGDWVPNTAYSKLALTWHRIDTGTTYVWDGMWPLGVLLVVALVGAWRADNRARVLLGVSAVVWVAYVLFIGGDIFPARRHLVPVLPALAMLAGHALAGRSAPWTVMSLALVGAHLWMVEKDEAYEKGRKEVWEWRCGVIATAVGDAFRDADALLAVNTAGCWPYFSDLDTLDMLGLNDAHIAKTPTPRLGHNLIGHELGDGKYVWERRPDLLMMGIWHGSAEPGFYGERQLAKMPQFKRDYRLVRFRSKAVWALIWVNTRSARIGPKRVGDTVHVPPWLFGNPGPRVVSVIDPAGRVSTDFATGASSTQDIVVPAGTWRVEADTVGPLVIGIGGAGELIDGRTLRKAKPGPVRVTLRTKDQGAKLRGVRLVRVD